MTDMKGQLTTWAAVREYVFAGNARFTLRSMKTGTRFTYRVRVKKQDVVDGVKDPTFFVSLLRGPDNSEDYAYMGVLRRPGSFHLTSMSKVTRGADSVKSLLWFLDKLVRERAVLGAKDGVEFWHDGRCGRCGRDLTVPESVARGLGPECAERMAA